MKHCAWWYLFCSLAVNFGGTAQAVSADPIPGDPCQFIRDRLASAPSGSTVVIPTGTYLCRGPIVLDRDNLTLQGAAAGVTLRLDDHINTSLIIIGHTFTPPTAVHNISVRNLTLDGNMAHQEMECWGGPCDQGGTSFIRNNGVTIRGAMDCTVENVITLQNRSGGLVTERGTRHLSVRNFESHDNFFDGLAGYETEDSVFSNLKLHHNRYAGISIDLRFNHNRFEDALISANGDVGIYARWSIGNSFDRMIIENSGNHGIYLAHDGEYAKCPNGYSFRDTNVIGSKGWGLWFNDAICDGTSFVNSKFADNRDGCYRVAEGGVVSMSNVDCK